jgi:hypothetical protein
VLPFLFLPEGGGGNMLDVAEDVAKDEVNLCDEDDADGVDDDVKNWPAAEDDVDGVMNNIRNFCLEIFASIYEIFTFDESKESSQSSSAEGFTTLHLLQNRVSYYCDISSEWSIACSTLAQ